MNKLIKNYPVLLTDQQYQRGKKTIYLVQIILLLLTIGYCVYLSKYLNIFVLYTTYTSLALRLIYIALLFTGKRSVMVGVLVFNVIIFVLNFQYYDIYNAVKGTPFYQIYIYEIILMAFYCLLCFFLLIHRDVSYIDKTIEYTKRDANRISMPKYPISLIIISLFYIPCFFYVLSMSPFSAIILVGVAVANIIYFLKSPQTKLFKRVIMILFCLIIVAIIVVLTPLSEAMIYGFTGVIALYILYFICLGIEILIKKFFRFIDPLKHFDISKLSIYEIKKEEEIINV